MSKAQYDNLEDGSFSGTIPQLPGVMAFGNTLFVCQKELESVLEGWLIVKIRHGDTLPVMKGAIVIIEDSEIRMRELPIGENNFLSHKPCLSTLADPVRAARIKPGQARRHIASRVRLI